MNRLRILVFWLFIVSITSCNFASSTPLSPTKENPTSSLPQPNSTEPPALTGNADIIFSNGAIITMDDANPSAEAIAIQGNKILAVGTNEDVLKHRGQNTTVINLEGKTLTSGFIDSHQHRVKRGLEGLIDLESTLNNAVKQGWTSINELYVPPDIMPQYLALANQDQFRLRVNIYPAANGGYGEPLGDWYKAYRQDQIFSPKVRIGGLKIFTGIDNDTRLLWTQEELNALLLARHQEGWHLAIKTVSTESLEMILIALENLEKTDPNIVNSRVRLEHALFFTPDQIARTKRLGVIPSIQTYMPGELVGEQDIAELTAREPQDSAFPWRSLVTAGVVIANGSAFPTYYVDEPSGAPFGSPMHLIYQAVTRVGNLGTQPEAWMLNQTITAEQALRALTIDAAYANFQDHELGSITPGKLADVVILSDNPLAVPASDINNIQVLMTMIDGKVEHCEVGFESLCPISESQSNPIITSPVPVTVDFTGNWFGPDPDDGSEITVSLAQQGNNLTGTFSDTFSGTIPPPGFAGNGSGNLTSPTSAQMTFTLTRSNGKTASIEFTLTLSNQNNTLTLTFDGGAPIVLQRQ
jgi:hypothetical protein